MNKYKIYNKYLIPPYIIVYAESFEIEKGVLRFFISDGFYTGLCVSAFNINNILGFKKVE